MDGAFLDCLEEDFDIPMFALSSSFIGIPSVPKKEAIALCEWALKTAGGDPDEAGAALRKWAKKNRRGQFGRAFDPFCADCGAEGAAGPLYPVPEDHLTFFEGDHLCGACGRLHGVL